jgi:hypothetical protein
MKPVDRRDFLKMAAAGSALAAAAAAVPLTGVLSWTGQDTFTFRAVAGLPKDPLPTYASLVVEGKLNLERGTGSITKSLYAGRPDAMSDILFPGTARSIRVTGVKRSGDTVRIAGTIDRGVKLGARENREVSIVIDRGQKVAHADFLGSAIVLQLQ